MIYTARKNQASYGEPIGILLLDCFTPFIPGDVANASTYPFPVRFQKVQGYTVERALNKDPTIADALLKAGKELVEQGVRAITGDCGYLLIHQEELTDRLGVPVFLSSLLQIPFISKILGTGKKVGIICADSSQLDAQLLEKAGVDETMPVCIRGLQEQEHFASAAIVEVGTLNPVNIEAEVVAVAQEMVTADPAVNAILLECSLLPPYGAAVQAAVGLPVFDYITMIRYVYSAVVKHRYQGIM